MKTILISILIASISVLNGCAKWKEFSDEYATKDIRQSIEIYKKLERERQLKESK